jgi:hypothetical protein
LISNNFSELFSSETFKSTFYIHKAIMPFVTINGNKYEIGSSLLSTFQWEPTIASGLVSAAAQERQLQLHEFTPGFPQHVLMHTKNDSLTKEQKLMLKRNGLEIQEYVGPCTYICNYSGKKTVDITELPFIDTVEVYPDSVVIEKKLKDSIEKSPKDSMDKSQGEVKVHVTLHDDYSWTTEHKRDSPKAAGINAEDVKVPEVTKLKEDIAKAADIKVEDVKVFGQQILGHRIMGH